MTFFQQENIWCFSSTHLTSPLFAQLRSLLSMTGLRSSGSLGLRYDQGQLRLAQFNELSSIIFYSLFSQVVACSVDSHFTHLAWMATPR